MDPDGPQSPSRSRQQRLPTADYIAAATASPPLSPTESNDVVLPRAISLDNVSAQLNEDSPLLSPTNPENGRPSLQYDGAPLRGSQLSDFDRSKSMSYLILLTIGLGGLQIAWTVEFSNGTPYLLSLGLSKSIMALVWIAGPLSGALVQPAVGIRSDNCRISWGKRKPFMVAGTAATIFSLLALAWTRAMIAGIFSAFGLAPEAPAVKLTTIITAVFFVYVLDFAINTVQAACRAFIVDCAPAHQQESANAWASRATGVGNIVGYLLGYMRLPKLLPFLGDTQFKALCVIASISLASTVGISCAYVRERDPRLDGSVEESRLGVVAFFRQVFKAMRRLPPRIRAICQVQFFAWIGWFPFLFYITTYIGQLYANPFFEKNPHMTDDEIDDVMENATRIGTFALLIFALTSFVASIFLPFIVESSNDDTFDNDDDNDGWKRGHGSASTTSFLSKVAIRGFTLRRAWMLSHVLFALTMLSTFFVSTPVGGTVLVGVLGISWAITLWAPFAFISSELSQRDSLRRLRARHPHAADNDSPDDDNEDRAGIILGLHNVSISAPQVIATVGSSVVFKLLQRPRGTAGDDSVDWVLRLAAVSALVAAYMSSRVREEDRSHGGRPDEEERL